MPDSSDSEGDDSFAFGGMDLFRPQNTAVPDKQPTKTTMDIHDGGNDYEGTEQDSDLTEEEDYDVPGPSKQSDTIGPASQTPSKKTPAKKTTKSTPKLDRFKYRLSGERAFDDEGVEDDMGLPIAANNTVDVQRSPPELLGQQWAYEDSEYTVVQTPDVPVKQHPKGLLIVDYKRNRPGDLGQLSLSLIGQPKCAAYRFEEVNGQAVTVPAEPRDVEGNYGDPRSPDEKTMVRSVDQKPLVPLSIHSRSCIQATLGFQYHEQLRKANEGCVLKVGNWCTVYDLGQIWVGQIYKVVAAVDGTNSYFFSFIGGNKNWCNEAYKRCSIELWIPPPKYEIHRRHRLCTMFSMLRYVKQFATVQTRCGHQGVVVFNYSTRYIMDLRFEDGTTESVCYLAIANTDPARKPLSPLRTSSSDDSPGGNRKSGIKTARKQSKRSGKRGRSKPQNETPSGTDSGGERSAKRGRLPSDSGTNRHISFSRNEVQQLVRDTVAEFKTTASDAVDGNGAVGKEIVETAIKENNTKLVAFVSEEVDKAVQRKVPLAVRNLDAAKINTIIDGDVVKRIGEMETGVAGTVKVAVEAAVKDAVDSAVGNAVTNFRTQVDGNSNRLTGVETVTGNANLKRLVSIITENPDVIDLLQLLGSKETDSQLIQRLQVDASKLKLEAMSQEPFPVNFGGEGEGYPEDEYGGDTGDAHDGGSVTQAAAEPQHRNGGTSGGVTDGGRSNSGAHVRSTSPVGSPGLSPIDGGRKAIGGKPVASTPRKVAKKPPKTRYARGSDDSPHPKPPSELAKMLGVAKEQAPLYPLFSASASGGLFGRKKDYNEVRQKETERKVHFGYATQPTSAIQALMLASSKVAPSTAKASKPIIGARKMDTPTAADLKLIKAFFDKAFANASDNEKQESNGVAAVKIPWKKAGSIAHVDKFTVSPKFTTAELKGMGAKAIDGFSDQVSAVCRLMSEQLLRNAASPIHWTNTPTQVPQNPLSLKDLYSTQKPPWNVLLQGAIVALDLHDAPTAALKIRQGVTAIQGYEGNFNRRNRVRMHEYLSGN